jgi:hypothetical protein
MEVSSWQIVEAAVAEALFALVEWCAAAAAKWWINAIQYPM